LLLLLLMCRWSKGKVLFASGSPFDPITDAGVVHYPAQANNAYIFPAVGYAAILAKSKEITGVCGCNIDNHTLCWMRSSSFLLPHLPTYTCRSLITC
jgi:hypothetical protein